MLQRYSPEEIEKAFLAWTLDQRANPERFMTVQELDNLAPEEIARASAQDLLKYLQALGGEA